MHRKSPVMKRKIGQRLTVFTKDGTWLLGPVCILLRQEGWRVCKKSGEESGPSEAQPVVKGLDCGH